MNSINVIFVSIKYFPLALLVGRWYKYIMTLYKDDQDYEQTTEQEFQERQEADADWKIDEARDAELWEQA